MDLALLQPIGYGPMWRLRPRVRSVNNLIDETLCTDFCYHVKAHRAIMTQLNIEHSQVRTFVLLNFVFTTLETEGDAEATSQGALLSADLTNLNTCR